MPGPYVNRTVLYRVLAGAQPNATGSVRLVYMADDPYAMQFRWGGREPWLVDRGLFAAGLECDAGVGSVRFSPCSMPGCEGIHITFINEHATSVLLFSRHNLRRALEESERLVPRGTEGEHADVERELLGLLGGAS